MKKYLKQFVLLYLTGFGMGILCYNLLLREKGYSTSLLPVYFSSAASVIESREYLFGSLLLKRGLLFMTGIICGLTPFGIPMVVLGLLWYGFLAGNLIAVFLTEYGIRGIGINGACYLPQALFYIPGWLFFFFLVMQMSQKSLGNGKREKADYKAYFFFLTGAFICILLGIWMESYVNQNLLVFILEKWI
nr:stage II sporulation protein M [uncultured Blautia sp.]